MAMSFVVEDGTGKSNATSYVSVEYFEQYWLDKGVDYSSSTTYPDATKQAWLNDATQYADLTQEWGGVIASDTQALDIPRIGWTDSRGREIDNSVPADVKNGICELAAVRRMVQTETKADTGVKSQTIGPVSVTYSGPASESGTTYPAANRWFRRVTRPSGLLGLPL